MNHQKRFESLEVTCMLTRPAKFQCNFHHEFSDRDDTTSNLVLDFSIGTLECFTPMLEDARLTCSVRGLFGFASECKLSGLCAFVISSIFSYG